MMAPSIQSARILIIDDHHPNVRVLEFALQRAGYANFRSTTDAQEGLGLIATFQPDLILLDLVMPKVDGFAVMHYLREMLPSGSYLPVLVLTADITPDVKRRALASGAKDFLLKPFDATEVLLRIHNLLEMRMLHLQLQDQNQLLEEKVRERTQELEAAQVEIIARLAQAAEVRDDDTGQHTHRVGEMAALLARKLRLPEPDTALIRHAAPLHDVGKIGIPDSILLKPGKLNPSEFEQMKAHTLIGARILAGSGYPVLQFAEQIALTHHERWDGNGYPTGLQGEEIPLPGRIVAVADVYDALVYERPYKPAWPLLKAVAEIERQSGRQFDPAVVLAFRQVVDEEADYTTWEHATLTLGLPSGS